MRVLVTFEQDASAAISEHTDDCVWAIDSWRNRRAAEFRWSEGSRNGAEITVFDPQPLLGLIPTVLEHHPDCELLEVRGTECGSDIWEELERHRFVSLSESPGVLRAGRQKSGV